MKNRRIIIVVLLIGQILIAQTDTKLELTDEEVLIELNELKKKKSLLQKEYLELSASYNKLHETVLEARKEHLEMQQSVNATKIEWYFTIFKSWGFVGAFVGGLIAFFGIKSYYSKKAEELVSKSLEDKKYEINDKIKREVAKILNNLTDIQEEFIAKNLSEFEKHVKLKEDSKILILNQDKTNLPEGFKKVLDLFSVDYISQDKIDVEQLKEVLKKKNIEKIKRADLLIIENQDLKTQNVKSSMWSLSKLVDEKKNSLRKSELFDVDEDSIHYNNKILVQLAEEICDKTSILYYGQQGRGFFPSDFVASNYQHMITFANAPSQLYGNMLNMLKFRSELNLKP